MNLFLKFKPQHTIFALKLSNSIGLQKKSFKRIFTFLFIDLLLMIGNYLFLVWIKHGSKEYFSFKYFTGFGVLLITWIISSFVFNKYNITKSDTVIDILKRIILSNFIALGIISIFIVGLQAGSFSRLLIFGTIIVTSLLEIILTNLYYFLIHSDESQVDLLNPPPRALEIKKARRAVNYSAISIDAEGIKEGIIDECGEEAFEYISEFADISNSKVLFISTTTRFNIQLQPDHYYKKIVNLKRVNDIQYINKFFESVNRKLPSNGLFIGCAETKWLRKKRILNKYFPGLNWIMYSLDFLVKRVFPKFILTKKLYFYLTRGENRVISRAEVLGRLYSCGFEVVDERFVNSLYYFVVKKVKEPVYDLNPSYGPFVKLKRIGRNGKIVKVYKFRTMHPFAEYLQEYVYRNHLLENGGKFKNDFRITTAGRIFRSVWLDELPMIINLLRGELKLVGVRPLSLQYFSLYSKELQEKRIQFKPGLVPPFYADLPETLEEIQASEMKYLEAYENHPFKTDFIYFWKAISNIIFHKVRSR